MTQQPKTTEQLLNEIPAIMESFPFEKVHAYMVLTNWQWVTNGFGNMETPSIEKLKSHAEHILNMAALHGHLNCGNGGFTAYTFPYGIKLSFEPFQRASF